MAKVILHPIGSPLEEALSPAERERNRARMAALTAQLRERRAEVREGWGPAYVERVHARGKLTAWERVEGLSDPGARIFPIQTFVNYGRRFGEGEEVRSS